MTPDQESARVLAHRLRALRLAGAVTQRELATALAASIPLISSWESDRAPVTPPDHRLQQYARFLAAPRSRHEGPARLLGDDELTEPEHRLRLGTEAELLALAASARGQPQSQGWLNGLRSSAGAAPWRFETGEMITIIPGVLPGEPVIPAATTGGLDRDYVESYRYADLDALIELMGHLRAVNPDNPVQIKVSSDLLLDDRAGHLVVLGGAAREFDHFLPTDPTFAGSGELTEDVGRFARLRNPFNRRRTLTICDAGFAPGVYGVVRALTDARIRDRNAEYLAGRFEPGTDFSILCRVRLIAGAVLVPDWTVAGDRLHEWPPALASP